MSFDYEQSIWGRGVATLRPSDPTAIRLRAALKAVKTLPNGAKVLELGCGAGQFIRAVKKARPELVCYGSDISVAALEEAKKTQDGVVYEKSEENGLPFEQNEFDAVLIFDVLEHVENPQSILNEIQRVLKKGGILYAFVPCEGDGTSLWHFLDMIHLKNNLTKRFAGHIQYFSRPQLFSLVTGSKMTIQSVTYSEHILGQLLGIAAFSLMERAAARKKVVQINNEDYFNEKKGWLYCVLSTVVNSLIYFESVVLAPIPSPNVHVIATKI